MVPSFRALVRVFLRIGCLSFGGPAGQIALMHKEIIEDRRWVPEDQYLHALNVCHLLPGPEAQQLATWIGWKLHGMKGGLAAGLLFVLPGACVVLALSILYAAAASLGWFAALFLGVKSAVLAIVVQALIRIGSRALNTRFKMMLAAAAFCGLAIFNLPFPVVVIGAVLIGSIVARSRPDWLALKPPATAVVTGPLPIAASVWTALLWTVIWALPMIAVGVWLGPSHILWSIGLFFSKLAVVTFGGAYAVLSYMAQQAVQSMGWLTAGEMADGLGLAETTPGPLILVTQFVGFLTASRAPAPFSPLVAGLLGAGLTTWVTFAPCFLWIFTLAPWIEQLEHAPRLRGALAAVTASVAGVIANLTFWFALHVFFAEIKPFTAGPVRVLAPVLQSVSGVALVLAALAAILLFRARLGVLKVLAITALAGLGLGWA